MYEVSVIRIGIGVIKSCGSRSMVEAKAMRDELKAQYPNDNVIMEWWN
jgi:hypothetical protein